MTVIISLTEKDLKQLVVDEIRKQTNQSSILPENVKIETKSSQNYKAEWESGAGFRATVAVEL